jgi:hypothetical protein
MVGMDGRAGEAPGDRPPMLRDAPQQQAARDPRGVGPRRREHPPIKARNQRLRKLTRPQPGKHRRDQCSGFSFAAASGLYLDICTDAELAENGQRLRERRNPFPPEPRTKAAPGVKGTNDRQGQRDCLAPPVGRALQPLVMQQDELPVGRQADVKLDPSAIELLCLAQAGERVFGCAGSSTAMADDRRNRRWWRNSLRWVCGAEQGIALEIDAMYRRGGPQFAAFIGS